MSGSLADGVKLYLLIAGQDFSQKTIKHWQAATNFLTLDQIPNSGTKIGGKCVTMDLQSLLSS